MKGWYTVAFERDLVDELTPARIGEHRLVLIREGEEVRAFGATCPHRGANLAQGRRCGAVIVCPFHGYQIRLGADRGSRFSVPEYEVLSIAGMVFVRLSPDHDHGWTAYMKTLASEQFVVNGFEMAIRAPMETVIENAFDRRHFHAVHGLRTDEFVVRPNDHGGLLVESIFYVPTGATGPQGVVAPAPYQAFVVSPGLASVALAGPSPYTVITGATDTEKPGECVIRLSLAYPKAAWQTAPPPAVTDPLLHHSRRGLEEDRAIWENLAPTVSPQWLPEDGPSRAFLEFARVHRNA